METRELPEISFQWVIIVASFAALTLLDGCDSQNMDLGNASIQVKYGKLRVHGGAVNMTNTTISDATINIAQVQVRQASGNYLTFTEENFQVDLLSLAAGAEPILAKARVPDGYYDSIRLITSGPGTVTLSDGRKFDLTVPSGEQTGIKIFFDEPILIQNSMVSRVQLDFDLSNSFVEIGSDNSAGGIRGFNFVPVIHAKEGDCADQDPDGDREEISTDCEENRSGGSCACGFTPSPAPSPTPSATPSSTPSPTPSMTPSPTPSSSAPGSTTTITYPIIGI